MNRPVVAHRYAVLRCLGRGASGTVYLAQDLETDAYLALKTPVEDHEYHLLASFLHPQIPACYGQIQDGNQTFLLMEWIRSETLAHYLERRRRISLNELHQILTQLCTLFQMLEEREPPIVYPDLHSRNVMRKPDGQLVLIDFGRAYEIAREQYDNDAAEDVCYCLKTYLAPSLEHATVRNEVRVWCREQSQRAHEGHKSKVQEFFQEWCVFQARVLSQEEMALVALPLQNPHA